MEKPVFIQMPPKVKEIADKEIETDMKSSFHSCKIGHQELKDKKVWIYVWRPERERIGRQMKYVQDMIVVMTKKGWKTWDADQEKWGKRVINPGMYGCYEKTKYDVRLDKKTFGKTIEDLNEEANRKKRKKEEDKRNAVIRSIRQRMKPIPAKVKKWAHENQKHFILFESGKRIGTCTNCAAQSEYFELKNRKYTRCPHCGHSFEARTYKTVPYSNMRDYMWLQKCDGGYLLRLFRIFRRNPKDPDWSPRETINEFLCAGYINGEEKWIERRCWDDSWYPEQERKKWFLNRSNAPTKPRYSPYYQEGSRRAFELRQFDPEEYSYLTPASYGTINDWIEVTGSEIGYILDFIEEPKDCWDFLDVSSQFAKHPQVEGLYKNGFDNLAETLLFGRDSRGLVEEEIELHKFMGIKKETFRALLKMDFKEEFDTSDLSEFKVLEETDLKPEEYQKATLLIPEKLAQFVEAAARHHIRFSTMIKWCKRMTRGKGFSQEQCRNYTDYLRMCEERNVNLDDKTNLLPNNINEAHDAMVWLRDEEEANKKIEGYKKSEKKFTKATERFQKLFFLETDDYILRPAATAAEIVREGQHQHNCVGHAGYIERMMEGKCVILFLRKKDSPEMSFYTIETDVRGNLRQAYAKFNKKTEDYKTNIKPILDQLTKQVQAKLERKSNGKKHIAAG